MKVHSLEEKGNDVFSQRVQIVQCCRDTVSMWEEPNKQEITVNGLSLTCKSFGIREATQRKRAWLKIRELALELWIPEYYGEVDAKSVLRSCC